MVIKNNQFTVEIFTIYVRKIQLTEMRKKLLQNKVKYLRDPPDFDSLKSTELMKIFQNVLENQLNQLLKQKRAPVIVTHSPPSVLARQFYRYK